MDELYMDLGIHEFSRLAAHCREVANLSPFSSCGNPAIDLRRKYDDMYYIRTAEHGNFYPVGR